MPRIDNHQRCNKVVNPEWVGERSCQRLQSYQQNNVIYQAQITATVTAAAPYVIIIHINYGEIADKVFDKHD